MAIFFIVLRIRLPHFFVFTPSGRDDRLEYFSSAQAQDGGLGVTFLQIFAFSMIFLILSHSTKGRGELFEFLVEGRSVVVRADSF